MILLFGIIAIIIIIIIICMMNKTELIDRFNGCLSGEIDDTKNGLCLQRFCPDGLEQGYYKGAHLCYTPCANGYISNGNDKCYKLSDQSKFYIRDEHPIPFSITHNVYRYFFPLTKCF